MMDVHAERFNMVMHSCHAFALVGIVEFIMYGCMKYFRESYMAASINISNPPNSVLHKSDTIYATED